MKNPKENLPKINLKIWPRKLDLNFNKFINGTGTLKRKMNSFKKK